jgi:hypothetical protein
LAGRFQDAFSFLTPASQVGTTPETYGAQMEAMRFKGATVESATCESDVCTVNVSLQVGLLIKRVGERVTTVPIRETWTVVNGQLGLIRR